MLSLFFKLLVFNLFIYFLFPFSSGIVAQCYYLFLQCLPTVWEGIADSETIVHSASRLGTGSNRRRQAFVFRKGIKKKKNAALHHCCRFAGSTEGRWNFVVCKGNKHRSALVFHIALRLSCFGIAVNNKFLAVEAEIAGMYHIQRRDNVPACANTGARPCQTCRGVALWQDTGLSPAYTQTEILIRCFTGANRALNSLSLNQTPFSTLLVRMLVDACVNINL